MLSVPYVKDTQFRVHNLNWYDFNHSSNRWVKATFFFWKRLALLVTLPSPSCTGQCKDLASCWGQLFMYKLGSWVALLQFLCSSLKGKWEGGESGSNFHLFPCFQGPSEIFSSIHCAVLDTPNH